MLEKGFNICSLAKEIKISRQWLGVVLERGHATLSYINKLAKALDVDPKEIVKLED